MNKILIILVCLIATTISAQNCPQYPELMRKAKQYWANGEFEKALNQLFAARDHCPSKSVEIDAQFVTFTNDIAKKFKDAKTQAEIAQLAKTQADNAAIEAQIAKSKSDSTVSATNLAARRAYANDLAYKSQIALKEGDRTSAYRLAEFAHRYVDDNNLNVTHALIDALYFNDKVNQAPLFWTLKLEGHSEAVYSVAFSPDGQRLATGSRDKTWKVWDLVPPQSLMIGGRPFKPAGLSPTKLSAYGLENLLDQKPNNEAQLIATNEIWQISNFADLYAEKIAKSIPLRADYERARRLYQACIKDAEERDKAYFQKKMAELEEVWKERGE